MKVRFFGRLAEAIGAELEVDALPGSSVAELRDRLVSAYPEAADALHSGRARTCVGGSLVPDDYRLTPGDALEFLPPVSGG